VFFTVTRMVHSLMAPLTAIETNNESIVSWEAVTGACEQTPVATLFVLAWLFYYP
jgi:hypothetical protein